MTPWLAMLPGLFAHQGGVLSPSNFVAPADVGETADGAYLVRWQDNDTDPTGLFSFYFQPINVPPQTSLLSPAFVGQPIPGGTDLRVDDLTNELTWDTSAVPDGTYFVYSVTIDPPLDPIYTFATFPVVVKHGSATAAPAVVVDEPDGIGDIVGQSYPVKWHASGTGALTATVTAHPIAAAAAPIPLAVEQPMVTRNGRQEGCLDWDVTGVEEGYHYVDVVVRDQAGRTHQAFSRLYVVVYRPPGDDAGIPPSGCVGFPQGTPDAGSDPVDPEEGCACELSPAERAPSVIALVLFVIGLAFLRRR